ncbi:MAG: GNAT family N-acetyltransferase [Thermoleophilia bacterium]
MDLVIREARPGDAAAAIAILNPIIAAGSYVVFDAPLGEVEERRYIESLPPRALFLVAERADDGVIVGLQSVEPFAAHASAFDHVGVIGTYVDLDNLRRGIARRLFDATFVLARRRGFKKLFTYIRVDNSAALAAYTWHGFSIVGRAERHAKIGVRYIDEIIVERWL